MSRRALLLVVLFASPAHAGRALYGWLPETETVGDGGIELTTSIYEHDNLGPYHERSSSLLWTPALGLTPCLELAIPVELVTRTADDSAPWSGIARYGAELRYRFLRVVPELTPLARFAVSRNVAIQSQVRTEVELAAAYEYGPWHAQADAGVVVDINFGHPHVELHPGAGASLRITDQLRLGAEIYAQLSRDSTVPSWAVFGPDVSWMRGRFWLSAVAGIGVHSITAAPRFNLGLLW